MVVVIPSLCLPGRGGTTQAGKSLTRCSLKKTKSWNLRLTVGFGVENIGRFVWHILLCQSSEKIHDRETNTPWRISDTIHMHLWSLRVPSEGL